MEPTTLADLVATVSGHTLRVRLGLWLVPPQLLGHEADEAARAGIGAEDLPLLLLRSLPQDTKFVGLTSDRLLGLLEDLCSRTTEGHCVLAFNLDLLLAGLTGQDRQEIWEHLALAFAHRPRAVIVALPASAQQLAPSPNLQRTLRADGRVLGT
jgi:hypothetical protein